MTATRTNPSLLDRLRDPADEPSWREFDARYRDLILAYARRLGLQHWDAEDVRQSVMLRLSRSLGQFAYDPERGTFRAYLGRVVRNAVVRHFEREGRSPAAVDPAHMMADSAPKTPAAQSALSDDELETLWEREWMQHHVRRALGRVRPHLRPTSLAVFERLLDGTGVDEVADELGLETENVRKIRLRVRRRVEELVRAQIREEEDGL